MIIRIAAFTAEGFELAHRIKNILSSDVVEIKTENQTLKSFVREAFEINMLLIFIGAAGIAVRSIAPFISDKLTDSPVIVLDENGKYVIPLLSGHVGAANEIALYLSDKLNAVPVITTATDTHGLFSVDVFARRNGFRIINRDGIKEVSSKLLGTGKIRMSISPETAFEKSDIPEEIEIVDYPPENYCDVIIGCEEKYFSRASLALFPKKYVLGIGCKKNTDRSKISEAVKKLLSEKNICIDDIWMLASIDLKAGEYGLLCYASMHHLPFITFSAKELEKAEGKFSESEFVRSVTGVSNVCERAAVLCAKGGKLISPKYAKDGVTLAVAQRNIRIDKWKS